MRMGSYLLRAGFLRHPAPAGAFFQEHCMLWKQGIQARPEMSLQVLFPSLWLYLLFLRLATGNCRVFFYNFLFRILARRCLRSSDMPVFRARGGFQPSRYAEIHEHQGRGALEPQGRQACEHR